MAYEVRGLAEEGGKGLGEFRAWRLGTHDSQHDMLSGCQGRTHVPSEPEPQSLRNRLKPMKPSTWCEYQLVASLISLKDFRNCRLE